MAPLVAVLSRQGAITSAGLQGKASLAGTSEAGGEKMRVRIFTSVSASTLEDQVNAYLAGKPAAKVRSVEFAATQRTTQGGPRSQPMLAVMV